MMSLSNHILSAWVRIGVVENDISIHTHAEEVGHARHNILQRKCAFFFFTPVLI